MSVAHVVQQLQASCQAHDIEGVLKKCTADFCGLGEFEG